MVPDRKHPEILTYLSSNERFINVICKIFENMKWLDQFRKQQS